MTTKRTVIALILAANALGANVAAHADAGSAARAPACVELAKALGTASSYAEASAQIERAVAAMAPCPAPDGANAIALAAKRDVAAMAPCPDPDGANAFALAAKMRDNGDPRASDYYECAIAADSDDPRYELDYADYLRIYRGPQQPLFPEAEEHYYRALRRIAGRRDPRRDHLLAEVQRRLAALYERDGIPVASWGFVPGLRDPDENRPLAFVSTQNRYARALDGFDEVDGVRDLALAEKFSASDRLRRPLTDDERRDLVHGRHQWETFDRLRFRYRWLPVLDVFFSKRHLEDAQVTHFADLQTFNDVDVRQFGFALERTFDFYPYLDASIRTEYAHGVQEGLIEGSADADEDFDSIHLVAKAARFWGPDKISFQLDYFHQFIDQDVDHPIDRSLDIVGATLRYQQFTPATFANLFDLRTNEVFAGFALSEEAFEDVDVHRNDVFVGVALRGLPWLNLGPFAGSRGRLDVELQPTLFSGDRDGSDQGRRVSSLSNSQFRTPLTLLYRFVDNENALTLGDMESVGPAHLAFLNLVLPFAQEVAIDGTNGFDSVQFGVDVAAKVIVAGDARPESYWGTTALVQAGYRFQRFYEIADSQQLFNASVKIGF